MTSKPFTDNQEMILKIARRHRGEWISTAGMCNKGGFSGRGLHFSFRKLIDLGLIETKLGRHARTHIRAVLCARCDEPVMDPCVVGGKVYCVECTCHDCGCEIKYGTQCNDCEETEIKNYQSE